jgi:hypothetical protein
VVLATTSGRRLLTESNCLSRSLLNKDSSSRESSENRRIPNGAWCLFKSAPTGSRQGKIVLVQLRDIQDPENGGQYTIKVYHSEKHTTQDSWEHSRITLRPESNMPGFSDLVFEGNATKELTIRGELVAVLGQK